MKYETIAPVFFASLALAACNKSHERGKTNVILIMADDMGYEPCKTLSVHYDPRWGNTSVYRNQFVRTLTHKLYIDGNFFDLSKDILEKNPLHPDSLTANEKKIKALLTEELNRHPVWVKKE